MNIIIKNKKLKNRLFKFLPKNNRFMYSNVPVFTIKEICKTLKIKVPKELNKIKNIPVHKTYLFDKLEGKEKIINEIKLKKYRRFSFIVNLRWKITRFKDMYDEKIEILNGNDVKLIQMTVEWLYVFYPIGFYYCDYFDYELYHRTVKEANKFLSRAYWWKVYKASNSYKKLYLLKNKEKFNQLFQKYVNRKFLNTNKCTYEEFEKFVIEHPEFFGKPYDGTGGQGAKILKVSEYKSIKHLYKYCVKNHLIIEEVVKQHKELAKFNNSTVNTIRLYSLRCADGKVRALLANFRTGRKGNDVDNFHCGGVTCVVDPKTGIIVSDAIDRHHKFYDKHPDSNFKFKGFQIPCWDKLIQAIEECGCLIPELRHIGWDIAITDKNEIELIEGNSMPNFDVTQAADQIGKLYIYKEYIDELEKIKIRKKPK